MFSDGKNLDRLRLKAEVAKSKILEKASAMRRSRKKRLKAIKGRKLARAYAPTENSWKV